MKQKEMASYGYIQSRILFTFNTNYLYFFILFIFNLIYFYFIFLVKLFYQNNTIQYRSKEGTSRIHIF